MSGNDAGVGQLRLINSEAEADCLQKEFTEAICPSVLLSVCLSIHPSTVYPFMHSTSNTEHLLCARISGGFTYMQPHTLFINSLEQLGEECVKISEEI